MNLKDIALSTALAAGMSACTTTRSIVKPCITYGAEQIRACTINLSDFGEVSYSKYYVTDRFGIKTYFCTLGSANDEVYFKDENCDDKPDLYTGHFFSKRERVLREEDPKRFKQELDPLFMNIKSDLALHLLEYELDNQ